jgi:hypothetical protein
VSRSDVSEPDDRDNAAATAFADYHAAWGAQDWSRVEARLAEDVESDDRRAWAQLRVSGRRAHLDVLRGAIDVGASRFTCRTLATRASRVALVEVFGGGRDEDLGAPTLGVLDVVELDLHGRIAAVVIFDTDDLDAAVAELDARYIAGEAAPFAGTWAAVVDAYRRFNEGRAGNWRGGTVDVNAFADVPGVRARATVVHRLAGRGALVTATGSAPEVDDWDWLVVFDVHDNEVRGIETYPTDEFDAALARFEALVASG